MNNQQIIYQYDLQNNIIKKWESLDEILESNPNYQRGLINANLKGITKSSSGFRWSFDGNLKKLKENPKIYQYDLCYNLLNSYDSVTDIIAKYPKFERNSIISNLNGKSSSSYRFIWSFEKDLKPPANIEKIYQYDQEYRLIKEWLSTHQIITSHPEFKRGPIIPFPRLICKKIEFLLECK